MKIKFVIKNFLTWFENKFGILGTALIVSLCLVMLAVFYYSGQANSYTEAYGEAMKQLVGDPFAFALKGKLSLLQYRILTPFLAHFLFLRGNLFFLFPNLMGVLFLSSVFYYFRKKLKYDIIESLVITSMFAFSSTIFVTLRFPWGVDTTSYFLIMLSLIFIDKKIWFFVFALSLLNHESNLFIAPTLMLLFIKKHYGRFSFSVVFKSIIFILLSILPMVLWKQYVDTQMLIVVKFNLHFDLFKHTFYHNHSFLLIGIFMSFKLLWYLPIYTLIDRVRKKDWYNSFVIIIAVIGVTLQLSIAEDMTRLMSLGFLGIIISIVLIKESYPQYSFKKIVLLNLLIPTCYVTGPWINSIYPFWIEDLIHWVRTMQFF